MRNLKKIILLLAVFYSAISFVYSQNSTVSESSVISETATIDESSITLNTNLDSSESSSSALSTFWLFFRMIFVLAIVVVCIYFVFKFLKKNGKTVDDDNPFLRNVSSTLLSQGKTVEIVTLLDKGYILGVSDNNVTLIDIINDKELVDAMNLYADRQQKQNRPKSFSDILEIFLHKSNKSIYDDAIKNTSDLLNMQRNRIDNGE